MRPGTGRSSRPVIMSAGFGKAISINDIQLQVCVLTLSAEAMTCATCSTG